MFALTGLPLIAVLAATSVPNAPNPGDPVGAYELMICAGPCSFAAPTNVIVQGVLVLVPGTFTASERQVLDAHNARSVYYTYEEPNACFALHSLREGVTYAGIIPLGISTWSRSGNEVWTRLYASADAWYDMTVQLTGETFSGQGVSSGVGAAEVHGKPDVVLGRRIGGAFAEACVLAREPK